MGATTEASGEEQSDVKTYEGTDWVIFIDSFGTGDLDHTPWIRANLFDDDRRSGRLDARPIYVTPVVLGSIYTGENPAENGLPSISRYNQTPRLRPAQATIPELCATGDEYENVLQINLPFIVPPQLENIQGLYWHRSTAMNQVVTAPGEVDSILSVAGPAGDMEHEENQEMIFNLHVDHIQQTFGMARSVAADNAADLVFLAIRTPDAYCHYHYTEGPDEDGEDATWRDLILSEIDQQVSFCSESGDVFVFGDHGARKMDHLFRANRWLMENGYLEVDVDHDYREKLKRDGIIEVDENQPGDVIAADQLGVDVDEEHSVAICADPFSTGITLLDGASPLRVADLIADLEAEDVADRVIVAADEWDGELIEECPDLYIQRKPGWFVSGNMADEPGGVELTRDGVHDPFGVWGSTRDLGADWPETVSPENLFDVITTGYLGIDPDRQMNVTVNVEDVELSDAEQREMAAHLQDMGYM